MKTIMRFTCVVLALAATAPLARSKSPSTYTRSEDVVYGRRDGLALTMDVFSPAKPNGAGVIVFVSAGFRSNRDLLRMFHPAGTTPFLDRGYAVFAVLLSSQPKYTVPEIVDDAHRAVRFVRHHAKKYGIDPERIGVVGASAGGHLALMMGCAGKPGTPDAADPVERESSRAAAVACFFPPSDLLALENACPIEFAPAFDIREIDPATGKFAQVGPERLRQLGRDLSPIAHASCDSRPVLIIHGEKDALVPLVQSKAMIAKLKRCGVECELVARPGKGHAWLGMDKDVPLMADWFDRHLAAKPRSTPVSLSRPSRERR